MTVSLAPPFVHDLLAVSSSDADAALARTDDGTVVVLGLVAALVAAVIVRILAIIRPALVLLGMLGLVLALIVAVETQLLSNRASAVPDPTRVSSTTTIPPIGDLLPPSR